jgi:hypothetical protein
VFPYEKAFVDQWTSRESVAKTASMIAKIIDVDIKGVIHIGGRRKSVFEYAKGLDQSKEIKELSISNVSFKVPVDTSLDCGMYNNILKKR